VPGVIYTERTVTGGVYTEGRPAGVLDEGIYALFDMPIPAEGGMVWADSTASYTEKTVPSSSYTEKTVSAVAWSEKAI